ncbi:histidine phosphatase family protein [Neorhizobium sp. JUb45]|uniref:histidine phosphatase family protein n=1 Tax=unclassified Neorhizobium TaxID=2629175 RepID=UPI0010531047|nr:histidine phosphatase family protein [Neorhizobium sp. JUb45]TCR04245.1 putative phosphoglycerate mutase [Neorhizobium sp. JUb45]
MLIYVIRHGQTDWNAEGRLQGQKDIDLNDFGRSQATANGEELCGLIDDQVAEFDFVSSPMARTRETMERLRKAMGLDPKHYRTDERLRELSFGDWEGFTLKEVRQSEPEKLAARKAEKWGFIPPGVDAESYEILSWRVGAWLQSVTQPTVCVCHGGVIRTLFRLVGNMPEDEAASIPIPQDRILVINRDEKKIGWI